MPNHYKQPQHRFEKFQNTTFLALKIVQDQDANVTEAKNSPENLELVVTTFFLSWYYEQVLAFQVLKYVQTVLKKLTNSLRNAKFGPRNMPHTQTPPTTTYQTKVTVPRVVTLKKYTRKGSLAEGFKGLCGTPKGESQCQGNIN